MKKFTSQKIKEFVSKPLFDEKIVLRKDPILPLLCIILMAISSKIGKILFTKIIGLPSLIWGTVIG